MSSHAFLIARTDALLIAEPAFDAERLRDKDLPGLKQLFIDGFGDQPSSGLSTVAAASERVDHLLAGELGQPWAAAWLGIFEGYGPPVSAIVCTRWRRMPFIANLVTAPGHRRRGYATSLIREVASLAEQQGDQAIAMTIKRDSPGANLLAELGFSELNSPVGV